MIWIKSIVWKSHFNEPKPTVIDLAGKSNALKETETAFILQKKNFVIDRENFLDLWHFTVFAYIFAYSNYKV